MLAKNERVLFLSVIEVAIEDAKQTSPRVRRAALEWLMRDQVDFPRICELAGVDYAYLRKKLKPYCAPRPISDACVGRLVPHVSSDAVPCCGTLGA